MSVTEQYRQKDRVNSTPYSGGETFEEALRESIRSAPWLALSLLLHLLAALVLCNMEWMTLRVDERRIIQSDYLPDPIDNMLDQEIVEKMERKFDDIEQTDIDPDPVEVAVDDDPVTPVVDELEHFSPVEGNNPNDVIGILGGGGSRFRGHYGKRGRTKGGGRATQKAVAQALDWLKRHQDPEGFWDCDGFGMQCGDSRCRGRGQPLNDVGVTGLALLAFLGAGNTIDSGPHWRVVKRGVRYLCEIQDPEDGCLVAKEGTHWMYNHAIAALALTEAYGLSNFPVIKKHTRRAVDFVLSSRNPGKVWRYNNGATDPIEQNDVSVTGWMIMCLASARDFGLLKDGSAAMEDALLYIDEMTDSATGRTGYKEKGSYSSRESGDEVSWPFDKTEAMTAVAMLSRVFAAGFLGNGDAQKPTLEAGAALLRNKLPQWDVEGGTIDFYYWYYGSYAMYQLAGKNWDVWKKAMIGAIVQNQCSEGCARGSWHPGVDPWGDNGGRVYSTAMMTLCLEVFYRYDNILGVRF